MAAPAPVPPEVGRWSWGAFLLGGIWGIGNNVWLALLVAIPCFGCVWQVVLGVKGNEWAWRARRWSSVEEFRRVQRRWAIGGLLVWVGLMAIGGVGAAIDAARPRVPKQIADYDGVVTMTVPEEWERVWAVGERQLAATPRWGETEVLVSWDDKEAQDGDLAAVERAYRDSILQQDGEARTTRGPDACRISGRAALRSEVEAVLEGQRSVLLLTVVDGPRHWVTFMGASSPERYPADRATLLAISDSLQIR